MNSNCLRFYLALFEILRHMGLFNFLKNVGSGMLKRKMVKSNSANKSEALNRERQEGMLEGFLEGAEIGIQNVDIEIEGEVVKVWGEAETDSDRQRAILMLGNIDGISSIDDRISVVGASTEAVEESIPDTTAEIYEVQSGDSLSKIAKSFYGDPMKYKVIFEANYPVIKDPNLIYPGQKIRIPKL